jgi:hypothetical protein
MSHQALRKSHGSDDHCTELCVTCWKCCMKKKKKMKKNNGGKICACDHFRDFWTLPVDPPHEIHLKYTRGGSRGEHTRRAPPLKLEKIWFFTWNTPKIFAPPSARRNFFKCTPPLTWNPGSTPVYYLCKLDYPLKSVKVIINKILW